MEDYETKDLEERNVSEDSDTLFEDDYSIHEELFQLKDKHMPISVTDIIDKASRFIFAEDLVSYISSEFHGLVYSNKVEKYSKTLFSPFNETIKHAACVIRWQIDKQKCPSFEIIGKLNISYNAFYENFVDAILRNYSEKGLKAGVFLYFCVYFAELASKCYRSDFEEVLELAVYAILDAFCLFNEGLYELNNFAKNILCKLKDRSFYLDLWRTQVEILDEQHRTCENPCFGEHFFSQENIAEENEADIEQLKFIDKSDKCEVIRNLEFVRNKIMGNSKQDELEEYRSSLERLHLVDKSNICEDISNLEFDINSITDNNQNEVEKYRDALTQLQLVDKSHIYEDISNLEFIINNIMKNYLDNETEKHRASLEQLQLVDKPDKSEAISNVECAINKIVETKENESEEKRACIEQLKLVEKSVKCEAISNLEFATNKDMENSIEHELKEYQIALQRLQLAEKCAKCDLEFAINNITENSEENEIEEYGAILEQLNLVDKCKKCPNISNLEFALNTIMENNKDNDVMKYRAALEQLKLVDKSDKCEARSNLEYAQNKVMKSSKENELEDCRAALEQLKVVDESSKYKVISNLEFDINKIGNMCQKNDVEEYRAASEQIKSADNSKECEVISNLEFAINKNIEKIFKSAGSNEKDIEFSGSESCMALLIDELCLAECEKLSSASESYIFGDILQEIMSVVSFEASIFSEIYLPQDNQLKTDQQDKLLSLNERGNIESTKYPRICNSGVTDSNFMSKQLASHNFDEKAENVLLESVGFNSALKEQENERNFENSSYIIEHKDVNFPNSELKKCEFEQDQLILQIPTVKSGKNSITKITADFTQLELKSTTNDSSAISDHSAPRQVVHDFFESNTDSQTTVISNSGCVQENERKFVVSSSILENNDIKFTNIESTGLNVLKGQLISQSFAENCDKNANLQLTENFSKLDCKNIDYDFTVDYSPVTKVDKQIAECFVIYKQEGEINEKSLKVLKGDSLLFAEDLIKYIAKEFYSISYSEPKFEEIRRMSGNALNESVKHITHFIHDESEIVNSMVFNFISNFEEHCTDWYRKYVVAILSHYVDDGLNSDVFLYYCLHFSELALKLYTLNFPEILNFAICSILDAFCLLKDDWNDFNVAVENLLKLFKNRKDNKNNNLLCFYYADSLEKVCVNTICGLLKSYTEQKIEIYLNNFMAFKNEDTILLSKAHEISKTDAVILEQNKS